MRRTAAAGRYGDGGGLYLLVRSPEARFWLFRYVREGKMREMGLGAAAGSAAVSLADARAKARTLHDAVRAGRDPLADRQAEAVAEKAAAQQAQARAKTFREVANLYLAAHEAGWRNAKHRAQWSATLETYAFPHMGDVAAADVETAHVMAALEPIWRAKPETAGRVRGRIESLLDYAKARGWRTAENPARWRGHVANMLPKRSKVAPVKHHAALPWRNMGAFMGALRAEAGLGARALEFAALAAARTGEVLGARWGEIDLSEAIWTVPGERMKAGREHRQRRRQHRQYRSQHRQYRSQHRRHRQYRSQRRRHRQHRRQHRRYRRPSRRPGGAPSRRWTASPLPIPPRLPISRPLPILPRLPISRRHRVNRSLRLAATRPSIGSPAATTSRRRDRRRRLNAPAWSQRSPRCLPRS